MKVSRDEFLKSLAAVAPGIGSREVVEQSTCYCFRDGKVITFNDEISCSADSPLPGIECAVPAKSLMNLLMKLPDNDLDVSIDAGKFVVKGKGRRSTINMDAQVALPVDMVETPADDSWVALDTDFCEAVEMVSTCVSEDNEVFQYTCLHLMPDFIEGCDNFQFARFPVATGLQTECLIRRKAAKHIVGLGVNAIAETASWLHFRNAAGMVLSCRRWTDNYPDPGKLLDWEGTKTTLPGGLAEVVARAEVFSSECPEGNHVRVILKPNSQFNLRIIGKGITGEFEERCTVTYVGEPLSFMIAPKLLAALTTRSQECEVTAGKLRINSGRWVYVACLFASVEPVAAAATA